VELGISALCRIISAFCQVGAAERRGHPVDGLDGKSREPVNLTSLEGKATTQRKNEPEIAENRHPWGCKMTARNQLAWRGKHGVM
jgi:hypothetical protein